MARLRIGAKNCRNACKTRRKATRPKLACNPWCESHDFRALKTAALWNPKKCCDIVYRGHLGLSAHSPKKVSKGVPGACRPWGPKKSENSQKLTIFQVIFKFLTPFSIFFWLLGPPGPRGPGNPFRDFFGLWSERPKWPLQMVNDIAKKMHETLRFLARNGHIWVSGKTLGTTKQAILAVRCASQKVTFMMRHLNRDVRSHCRNPLRCGHDAGIIASALPRCGRLVFFSWPIWRVPFSFLPCDPEVLLQTPKPRKIQRHRKVTQKWLLGLRPKWLKSYLKVTQK